MMNNLDILAFGWTFQLDSFPEISGHYYKGKYYIKNSKDLNLARISKPAFEIIFGKVFDLEEG